MTYSKNLFRTLLLGGLLLPFMSFAAIEAYEFKDANMEAEYTQLINELRCLVCQNQNLSGSDADLAKDLRRQTHEMLMKGKSSDEVIQFMVERYGDFVLYRPQFQRNTWLLWAGPFVLIVLVVGLLIRKLRHKQMLEQPDESTLQRAKALLDDSPEKP